MAGSGVGKVFGGGSSVLLHNSRHSSSSEPFFISGSSSSSSYLGSGSMVSFEDVCGGKRSETPFFCTYDQEENGDEDFDEYLHQPEKKRRLTVDQVQFLEKSFEVENKLEPERKIQLAKDLGLQPRQVAIWFQNRRARWKTKQLEKDFDTLQANYNNLKGDYENLLKEKEKLKAEVVQLADKLQIKENEQRNNSEQSGLCDQLKTAQQEPNVESASESEDQHGVLGYNKQGDQSSAKSDIIDSDCSARYVEAVHSSYAFEADQSDISQDDEDYINRSLLPPSHVFPKIEDADPPANSCHFDLHGDDHAALLWPYWDINLKMPTSMHM